MTNENFQIGQEVVRTIGDYVVGRIGNVIAIDGEKNRAQVKWIGETTTWVSFKSLALTSIPYEITPGYDDKKKGKFIYPKYVAKPRTEYETKKVMYNGIEVDAINFGTL